MNLGLHCSFHRQQKLEMKKYVLILQQKKTRKEVCPRT